METYHLYQTVSYNLRVSFQCLYPSSSLSVPRAWVYQPFVLPLLFLWRCIRSQSSNEYLQVMRSLASHRYQTFYRCRFQFMPVFHTANISAFLQTWWFQLYWTYLCRLRKQLANMTYVPPRATDTWFYLLFLSMDRQNRLPRCGTICWPVSSRMDCFVLENLSSDTDHNSERNARCLVASLVSKIYFWSFRTS